MKQTRYSGIDALRMIGCLCITIMHIKANTGYEITGMFYNAIIPSFAEFVQLFLIISAFGLCCGYYESTSSGKFDTERFYSRRYGKLWVFFALLVLLDVVMQRTPEALAEGFLELTMTFGLLPNNSLNVIGVSWTLGLIFVFYFMFPFFVFLWNKKSRAWFAFAVSMVISLLCCSYFFSEKFVGISYASWKNILYASPFFLAGGLLYLYKDSVIRLVKRIRWLWLLICIGLTVSYTVIPPKIGEIDLLVVRALIVFVPWLAYVISVDSPVLSNPVTKFFSDISMEIYLSHMVAFRLVEKLGLCYLFGKGTLSFIVTIVLTMGVMLAAIFAYRWVYGLLVKCLKARRSNNPS